MTLRLCYSFITVDDPDVALAFYRDVVGLEVRNDVSAEGFRWLTMSLADQPDLEIVLSQPHGGRSQADGDALAALLAKGALNPVVFATDDVDATFDRMVQAGAEVLQEPMDQPYGVRDCAFRDPCGNLLRFNGSRGDAAGG
jgi:predicted enzyme related to lactoylglutathione lyase